MKIGEIKIGEEYVARASDSYGANARVRVVAFEVVPMYRRAGMGRTTRLVRMVRVKLMEKDATFGMYPGHFGEGALDGLAKDERYAKPREIRTTWAMHEKGERAAAEYRREKEEREAERAAAFDAQKARAAALGVTIARSSRYGVETITIEGDGLEALLDAAEAVPSAGADG